MRKVLANIFSCLLHPLLVPLYGFILLACDPAFMPYVGILKLRFLLIAALILVVIPVAWYLVLRKIGVVTTWQADNRWERFWPYLLTCVAYIVVWRLGLRMRIGNIYSALFLSGGVSLTVLTLVNFFWKMSAHAVGMGALLGGILLVSIVEGANPVALYCVFILLGGCVGAARLELQAHTMGQLTMGYLVGLMSPLAALLVQLVA